ncbi:MAG: putative manganese-dependent inorganic diphosphatase [Deltaproteobacteria bacterium]|nr:putative manganese-dependent inorganic diphosphatase [Deltaproteobacteria bacterium]
MEGSGRMGDPVYVIGHKNPDTDSICSAIGLAELKRAEGMTDVHAARAGDVNPQTAFILDYFKVPAPRYLPNVYPKARDIMSVDVVHVTEDAPLLDVIEIMREERVRFIPVLDKGKKPVGALTLMDLARRYITVEAERSRVVETSLANIIGTLKAKAVLDFLGTAEKAFSVFIGAMAVDSFLGILGERDPAACAVIVGDRDEVQTASIEKGVGLLIVTGGFPVKERMVELARARGTSIVVSPHDTATTALLVRLSTPARSICEAAFEKASPDDLVEDIRYRVAGGNGIVVLDSDGVMRGVITKSNLLRPSGTSLVLVDHNELSQAVDGAEKVDIIEVIDHHRVGNFQTAQPIPFICDPVGSTSTLVSELYRQRGVPIRKEIAGLLLGGVLSDTVILKSPTTTGRDEQAVKWLEEKAGLDHAAFGKEIFAATSSLKKRGAAAAVKGDFKVFEVKGRKFGIGQVETIGFGEFHEEKERLREELVKVKEKKDLQLSGLLVTDIVYGTSLFLAVAEREVLYNLDYPKMEDGVYELKNVISRKKQVVPHIIGVFDSVY